jgi:hypothetical protein
MVGSLNELSTHAQIRVRPRILQQHGDDDGESLVEASQAPKPMTREWRSLMAVLALAGILLVRCFSIECRAHGNSLFDFFSNCCIDYFFPFLFFLFFSFCRCSWAPSQRQSFAWQSQEDSFCHS